MSTITNTTIVSPISLSTSSNYTSPLTITTTDIINAGTNGRNDAALDANSALSYYLLNQGRVSAAGTVVAGRRGW
jgi:hypothetical protein